MATGSKKLAISSKKKTEGSAPVVKGEGDVLPPPRSGPTQFARRRPSNFRKAGGYLVVKQPSHFKNLDRPKTAVL